MSEMVRLKILTSLALTVSLTAILWVSSIQSNLDKTGLIKSKVVFTAAPDWEIKFEGFKEEESECADFQATCKLGEQCSDGFVVEFCLEGRIPS